jgi:hypothetical protein
MGILDFSPDEWPGLLGTPLGRLPPQGPTAPFFVPPMEAAYSKQTPGGSGNTTPSPLAKATGEMMDSLATKLAAARARAMAPEAPDHGLSERQKLSPLQQALNPITSYPETYMRMNQDARNQISRGIDQIMSPETDQSGYPASISAFDAAPHGLSNVAKGELNVALGTAGYVASPITAADRSLIGQPIEDVTGIPRDYTEFAAQLATPGFGLLKMRGKPGLVPPRPAPNGPSGIASPEVQATQELPAKLPNAAGPASEATAATSDGSGIIPAAQTETAAFDGPMTQLRERYALTSPPVCKFDKETGEWYLAKDPSQEELQLEALLDTFQRDIDAGKITPHFDPAKRRYADGTYYPRTMDTGDIKAVRASTQQKHEDIAHSTEATQRLDDTFERGEQQKENARDFSAVGELEDKFIQELGPDKGREEFRKWAETVATTSPGADPRANLRGAQFARYMRTKGLPLPIRGADIPYPAGSRFGAPNLKQFQKILMEGSGITSANPKLYDYASELLGHTDRGPPIDEQRFRLMDPERSAPPPGSYGHYKGAVVDRAAAHGVSPTHFGDMLYAGARENHWTKPLITYINEMIERTHRVTGMARDEIVRRGLVRGEIPLFGLGGILAGKKLSADDDDNGT